MRSCNAYTMLGHNVRLQTSTGECVLPWTAVCFSTIIGLGSTSSIADSSARSLTVVVAFLLCFDKYISLPGVNAVVRASVWQKSLLENISTYIQFAIKHQQ